MTPGETDVTADFFKQPILNSPYDYPQRHWELDEQGQPTGRIVQGRRPAQFITPVPKPRQQKGEAVQLQLLIDLGLSEEGKPQQYDTTSIINRIRDHVDRWRMLTDEKDWRVTPVTARLLKHWRHHNFHHYRPFFCQIEAVETLIWLTEVAPKLGKTGEFFSKYLTEANETANPGLLRTALKLATGAGKTTVMAMIIAWQTINAVRQPNSTRFTKGFLVVTPGITIRDRLRVLLPNDPDNYYKTRELVPSDMLRDLQQARIVITNYHAFKLRERMELSKGGRLLLQGRGPELKTVETEGQMLQRVMPGLMNMKRIMVLNDEAHHCYRERPDGEEEKLKGDERIEAEKNREAARLWLTGLEIVQNHIGISRVVDLSATPFFLRGSGWPEGVLFPWTVSDFSLIDAIECGIVKLPRVPVADNIPGQDMPKFRNLWEHIRDRMPRHGRRQTKNLDPRNLPNELITALQALYGHYEKAFELWQEQGIRVPPCFIIVCNNTATSKLLYDYVAGFCREDEDGNQILVHSGLKLFSNFDEYGNPLPRPRTLLIDSEQLESGEALDPNFRKMAAEEIERFRREIIERTGDRRLAENLSDEDLLREAMNTVGKEGRLGESIRCVVSVAMLTEGWDANTVTHILGVRAFGTQLLCEQVVGRALRRQSYELNEQGRFNVEYADVLGVPFDFTAKPVVSAPQPPADTIHVRAVSPKRDHLEIRFPRVAGYRVELPREELQAKFTKDSIMDLDPKVVGPTRTIMEGLFGEGIELTLEHLESVRTNTLVYHLTLHLLLTRWRDPGEEPKLYLFGQLKRIVRHWLDNYLVCLDGAKPAQLLYWDEAERACEKIQAAITSTFGEKQRRVTLDPYNPEGSTRHVNFTTSKKNRWQTHPQRCHVNWAILDSDWEAEFCRVVEQHPRVRAYVKNQGLGFEVPYREGSKVRTYLPDFIVLVDDGRPDPLHLVVEIKGFRGEDARAKKTTMETYWVPGVNALGTFGRWDFVEFTDIREIEAAFDRFIRMKIQAARETA